MVSVALPGERWEVEFLNDGSVEIERFISQGEISGEESLNELFSRYSDPEDVSIKTWVLESTQRIRNRVS
jgi:hypothetical protein